MSPQRAVPRDRSTRFPRRPGRLVTAAAGSPGGQGSFTGASSAAPTMTAMAVGRRMHHALLASLLAVATGSFVALVVFVLSGSAVSQRIGLVLACLSVGGIGMAGVAHVLREDLPVMRRWRRVTATVTACRFDASSGYLIDVVYRPVHDRAFIGTLQLARRRRVGGPIRVRVDPADPGRIREDITLRSLMWGVALFCVMGGLPLSLALDTIGRLPHSG